MPSTHAPTSSSDGLGTARTEWTAAPTRAVGRVRAGPPRHPVQPGADRAVAEPLLDRVRRRVAVPGQTAGEVAGVEQGDPDPGLARGREQRVAHGVRVGVGTAGRRVVQVVELADDRVPGQRPSRRTSPGPGRSSVSGSRRCGDRIHLLAPRPEVAAAAVGPPAQRAVEGVAVGVGEAGQHDPGQADVAVVRRARRDSDPAEPAVGHGHPHRGGRPGRQPGVLGPVASVTRRPPSRSASTAVRAATPARQSASSACSAGECETPVGLRTKSIADGMPCAARMPASWPAPVPRTGGPGPSSVRQPARRGRGRRRSSGSRTPR